MLKAARTLKGVEHSKYEPPNEIESRMEESVKKLEEIMSKHSEVESQTIIVNLAATNEQSTDVVTSGCIFGCLTSKNREQYVKFSKLLQQTGSINASVTLTPVNFIILERFWSISDPVRNNLVALLADMTTWRLTRIEIVLGNAIRQFMEFGSLNSRYSTLLNILRIIKQSADFLFKSKECGFLIAVVVNVCMHYLIEIKQCPPELTNDARRVLLHILETIMNFYSDNFHAVFGRNVILVLTILSRYSEMAAIWKQLTLTPANLGVVELLRRPPEKWYDSTVIPLGMARKFEFLHHTNPELTKTQFREMYKNSIGEGSMKGYCLRAFLNPNTGADAATMDVRAINIANILNSCKTQNDTFNMVEFQTCKLIFFFEWLGYDVFPSNLSLPLTIVTSWKALFHISTTNGPLISSLYEFLIFLVQTLYPPLTPIFVKSVTRIIQILSKSFPVGAVLDSTKVEKPLRELFKETFPELAVFFRRSTTNDVTVVPVSPIVEKAPQISVTSVIDVIEIPSQPKDVAIVSPKPKKKIKKRPHISATTDDDIREVKVVKLEAGWDSTLGETIEKHIGPLPDDIKEELTKLESVIKDGSGDGVVEIEDAFGAILRSSDSLLANDELKDCIADSLLVIFKKFLMDKNFYTPKDDEKWDVRETFKKPFYIIFKQLYTNDETAIIFSILESMYPKCPIVGYLLLFYVLSSRIQEDSDDLTKDEYVLAYQEFCKSNNKDASVELAEDLEACALDDYKLYRYLLPKVFEMFGKEATGSVPLFRTICTHCDSSTILDLISNTFLENLQLFRRDSFGALLTASLEWNEYEQVFFWDLVKGEGVAYEWLLPVLSKLDFEKNSRACFNILLQMRTYGEPNMATLRPLISRQRGDKFVLNAFKILIQDESDCLKFTATINNLMKKAIEGNDILEGKKSSKQNSAKKTIPLQTILGHLDVLRKNGLAKPRGETERALKEFAETFSEIKANPALFDLSRGEFGELFAAVEILSGHGGLRNLRKNRQRSNFEADVSCLYENEKSSASTILQDNKSPPKRRRIKDDSDSD